MNALLKERYRIEGTIKTLTGLHIGSGREVFTVGGVDSFVITTPQGIPYIPGSSLKGKLRSELEWEKGNVVLEKTRVINEYNNKNTEEQFASLSPKEQIGIIADVRACNCGICGVCQLLGHTNTATIRLPRTLFRDCFLTSSVNGTHFEEKHENTISRITSDAIPRLIQRVPAGTCFEFRIVFKRYEIDGKLEDFNLLKLLFEGLNMVEMDSLGGNGSRGSGSVTFEDIKIFSMPSNMEKASVANPGQALDQFAEISKKLTGD